MTYVFTELQKANSDMARNLKACTKANEDHTLRNAAEKREALTEGKLKLEQDAH